LVHGGGDRRHFVVVQKILCNCEGHYQKRWKPWSESPPHKAFLQSRQTLAIQWKKAWRRQVGKGVILV
jgi:hypothetical protein